MPLSSTDWILSKLKEVEHVSRVEPIAMDFILIHRKHPYEAKEYPPFIAAVVSTKLVTDDAIAHILGQTPDFNLL